MAGTPLSTFHEAFVEPVMRDMTAWWAVAVLLALACSPVAAADGAIGAEDKFCIVVRTYRGHADPASGLPRLLRSLQRQSHQRQAKGDGGRDS